MGLGRNLVALGQNLFGSKFGNFVLEPGILSPNWTILGQTLEFRVKIRRFWLQNPRIRCRNPGGFRAGTCGFRSEAPIWDFPEFPFFPPRTPSCSGRSGTRTSSSTPKWGKSPRIWANTSTCTTATTSTPSRWELGGRFREFRDVPEHSQTFLGRSRRFWSNPSSFGVVPGGFFGFF